MWQRTASCLVAALAFMAGGSSACAQTNYKSQLGTVSQRVMETRIEVRYRRPVARGRDLFGALVPWGKIWTPIRRGWSCTGVIRWYRSCCG